MDNQIISEVRELKRKYRLYKVLDEQMHRAYLNLCDRREIGEDVSRELIEEAYRQVQTTEKLKSEAYYQIEQMYVLVK